MPAASRIASICASNPIRSHANSRPHRATQSLIQASRIRKCVHMCFHPGMVVPHTAVYCCPPLIATACRCMPLHAAACRCMSLHAAACRRILPPADAYRCLSLPATACRCLSPPATACRCSPLHTTAYRCLPLPFTACHRRSPHTPGSCPNKAPNP